LSNGATRLEREGLRLPWIRSGGSGLDGILVEPDAIRDDLLRLPQAPECCCGWNLRLLRQTKAKLRLGAADVPRNRVTSRGLLGSEARHLRLLAKVLADAIHAEYGKTFTFDAVPH
jgi:hypothetical protein